MLAHDLTYGHLLHTTIKRTLQEMEVSGNTQTPEVIDWELASNTENVHGDDQQEG